MFCDQFLVAPSKTEAKGSSLFVIFFRNRTNRALCQEKGKGYARATFFFQLWHSMGMVVVELPIHEHCSIRIHHNVVLPASARIPTGSVFGSYISKRVCEHMP